MEEKLRKIIDPNNECCCEYHLMAKCKEWAHRQGYTLHSGMSDWLLKPEVYVNLKLYGESEEEQASWGNKAYFSADSEQQAVFDATSWVLEQAKNNKSPTFKELVEHHKQLQPTIIASRSFIKK